MGEVTPVVTTAAVEWQAAHHLPRIHRGPCGGWHYDGYPATRGRRGHRASCQACIRLGSLPAAPGDHRREAS